MRAPTKIFYRQNMFNLNVELFGLPQNIAIKAIEVSLPEGSGITDLVAALRQAIPALNGSVVSSSKNRLMESYVFNINGHFYSNNRGIKLKTGDKVKLLALASGG